VRRFTGSGAAALLLFVVGSQSAERPPLLTVSVSEDHAIEGGKWNSRVLRTADPWTCGTGQDERRCVEHSVIVDNPSTQSLECTAAFSSQSGSTPALNGPDVPALVLPRTSHEIRGPIATTDTKVELAHLDCRARPPYRRLKVAPECKYQMFGRPFEEYYPAVAVSQALEGPVVVAFLLPDRNGRASEIAVVDSSLVYSLDEAAKRFVSEQRFSTDCPGTRFDVRMRFTLRDRYVGLPGR
jgi:TonB family protein